jgi:hypothetical protein
VIPVHAAAMPATIVSSVRSSLMPRRHVRRLLAVVPMVGLLACRDAAPTEAMVDLTRLVPEGNAQVMLQELPGPTEGTLTYVVRVVTRLEGVASYQGEVTFAPGSLELLASRTPAGSDGEMFLVNAQGAQGRLRFSALTTERFSTDEAFRFTVRPTGPLSAARLAATLDIVGHVSGTAVDRTRVRSADGVRDVKGRLVTR